MPVVSNCILTGTDPQKKKVGALAPSQTIDMLRPRMCVYVYERPASLLASSSFRRTAQHLSVQPSNDRDAKWARLDVHMRQLIYLKNSRGRVDSSSS